jgi:dihydrofolate reductase
MIQAILACDGQGGIARNGVMPWPRNELYLRHFRNLTRGAAVVMGRATWEADDMPSPLPGRTNVVVTRDPNYAAAGATIISDNLEEHLTNLAKEHTLFIIGGASLFARLIDSIDQLHLTRIAGDYDCDTFLLLDQIAERFEVVNTVTLDENTVVETHVARNDRPIK